MNSKRSKVEIEIRSTVISGYPRTYARFTIRGIIYQAFLRQGWGSLDPVFDFAETYKVDAESGIEMYRGTVYGLKLNTLTFRYAGKAKAIALAAKAA